MCCLAVSQLLVLGKSVISSANKSKNEDDENDVKIDWPEDPISKAKIIRWKAQSISVDMEKVSTSFATGNEPHAELITLYVGGEFQYSQNVNSFVCRYLGCRGSLCGSYAKCSR